MNKKDASPVQRIRDCLTNTFVFLHVKALAVCDLPQETSHRTRPLVSNTQLWSGSHIALVKGLSSVGFQQQSPVLRVRWVVLSAKGCNRALRVEETQEL